mmetsp:Transcript_5237/g.11456  ORF Transcript_5237/g.11456 Transcript_5237/m.11456 type:complete len:543 (+) Transcript_5237:67-1695(+)
MEQQSNGGDAPPAAAAAQQQQQQQVLPDQYDDEPAFIDPNTVEEVQVDLDGDEPMSDDDDEDGGEQGGGAGSAAIGGAVGAGVAATATTDGTNQPQTAVPDQSIATLKSHAGPVYAVATHFDASSGTLRIVSGGGDDRAYLHTVTTSSAATAAAGGSSSPKITTIPLSHAHTDSVSSVAINSQYVDQNAKGKASQHLIAVGSYDGTIILYDAHTGNKVQALDGPTDVEFVSFHPKGGTVVLAGSISDGTVWMYHTPSCKCLQVFVGHEGGDGGGQGGQGGVSAGTFTPDGKFAISAGMDGTLRIWAPRTGICRHTFRLAADSGAGDVRAGLTCLEVDGGADGQLAVVGSEDGLAYVVHLAGKKIAATLRHYDESPGGQAAGAAADGMDVDEDGDGGEELRSVEAVGFAGKAVNPNWVATGGVDGALKVWDVTHGGQGQCRQVCRPPAVDGGAVAGVTRLSWHSTLPLILASYTDGAVRMWDARDGSLVTTVTGGHAGVMINGMSAEFVGADAPDGGRAVVVTAVDDGAARVFEINVAAAQAR